MVVINDYIKITLWLFISLVYLVRSENVFTAKNVDGVNFSELRLSRVLPHQSLNDDKHLKNNAKKLGVQKINAEVNQLEIDEKSTMRQANNIPNINIIQKIQSDDWEKINFIPKIMNTCGESKKSSDEIKWTKLSNIAQGNENHNRYQRCLNNFKKKTTKNLLKTLIAWIKTL